MTSATTSLGSGSGTTADVPPEVVTNLLRQLPGTTSGEVVHQQRVKAGVYRLRCSGGREHRSFYCKRLDPDIARRNELVARRWLPAIGLEQSGPPLLATAAEWTGRFCWHLYEDLGEGALDPADLTWADVEAALAAVARMHVRFAEHPLIAELRLWGGELGLHFYRANLNDATTALRWVARSDQRLDDRRAALCERLLQRLARLRAEHLPRAAEWARHGGPDTLLHGDLWPSNVLMTGDGSARRPRLIDWDHAGVGPFWYDLSTWLSRLPRPMRRDALAIYAAEVGGAGRQLPDEPMVSALFETAELARLTNRLIWPALAVIDPDGADSDVAWAFAELEEVESWFLELSPILPPEAPCGR